MQGSELKEARKALGMTQADMAAALGMTSVFIGMMERGERPIELRTVLAVRHLALIGYIARARAELNDWIDKFTSLKGAGCDEVRFALVQLEQLAQMEAIAGGEG